MPRPRTQDSYSASSGLATACRPEKQEPSVTSRNETFFECLTVRNQPRITTLPPAASRAKIDLIEVSMSPFPPKARQWADSTAEQLDWPQKWGPALLIGRL